MKESGYNSYYQVLNAKDYGIPQNRERVFTISIRQDIDTGYTFPKKQELKLRLKDMLESNDGIMPTMTTRPDILGICVKNNTKQGYLEAHEGDGVYTNTSTKRGTVQPQMIHTISTIQDCGVVDKGLRIRKLTPKECWRLMGFTDEEFEKAQPHSSNSQLYKQAGNSIVVNVLEGILKNLIGDKQ